MARRDHGPTKKEQVRPAVTVEMMSSEDVAGDDNGRQMFMVKPLPWQTTDFLHVKD